MEMALGDAWVAPFVKHSILGFSSGREIEPPHRAPRSVWRLHETLFFFPSTRHIHALSPL